MWYKSTGNDKVDQALQLLMQASSEKQPSLSECLGNLCENLQKAKTLTDEKIKDSALIINTHVHEKPWIYVAYAALGGLVIGLFCRRS